MDSASHARTRRRLPVSSRPGRRILHARSRLGVRRDAAHTRSPRHATAISSANERPVVAQPPARIQPRIRTNQASPFDRRSASTYSGWHDCVKRSAVRRAISIFVIVMLAACSRSTAANAKPQATATPTPASPQGTPPPAAAELPAAGRQAGPGAAARDRRSRQRRGDQQGRSRERGERARRARGRPGARRPARSRLPRRARRHDRLQAPRAGSEGAQDRRA